MTLKDVRAKLNVINKTVEEHLDFLLEIRQDEQLYKDDIDEIGEMADNVLSTLTKHSDLLRAPAGGEKDWVCEKCGNSTFETDYDYLVHPKLHLECALSEHDGDNTGRDDEIIVNKDDWDGFAEELKNKDTGHQPC